MASCEHVIDDNIAFLRQARELVQRLTDDAFTLAGSVVFGSSVGAHLRHVLDHYARLSAGWTLRKIDYDARERDERIENDRSAAIRRIDETIDAFLAFRGAEDQAVSIKMDCGENTDPETWWTTSTLRRECQFLVSHTVHHFALIRMILAIQGIEPAPSFGVAPSTLRHHARLACAR